MNLIGLDVAPETTIYVLFLCIGAIFLVLEGRMLLFPGRKGIIVGVDGISSSECASCSAKKDGKVSYSVTVLTDGGKRVKADMSPCVLCMNKIGLGSRVGVTKMGERMICHRVFEPFGPPEGSAVLPEKLLIGASCGGACSVSKPKRFNVPILSRMQASSVVLLALLIFALVMIGISLGTSAGDTRSALVPSEDTYDIGFMANGSGFREPVLRALNDTTVVHLSVVLVSNVQGNGPVNLTLYDRFDGSDNGSLFDPLEGGYSSDPLILNDTGALLPPGTPALANWSGDVGPGNTTSVTFDISLGKQDIGDHVFVVVMSAAPSHWTFRNGSSNVTAFHTPALVITRSVNGAFEGEIGWKDEILTVRFAIGFIALVLFFSVIVLSLKGKIPQDRLPIQAALVLSAFVIVLLSLLGWVFDHNTLRISSQDLAGMIIIHPITALVAGFMVAGALEAAGAFDAAADALSRIENMRFGKFIPFGVPGTVMLLVNVPTIIAMPCGRILAAALMPAALYFGFKVARQVGNVTLVGTIVFGFIVNAAASCGPSPLGGIGTIGEGMTHLEIGAFSDAQQLGILYATTVCMLAMKFITPMTPPVMVEKFNKMMVSDSGDENKGDEEVNA